MWESFGAFEVSYIHPMINHLQDGIHQLQHGWESAKAQVKYGCYKKYIWLNPTYILPQSPKNATRSFSTISLMFQVMVRLTSNF